MEVLLINFVISLGAGLSIKAHGALYNIVFKGNIKQQIIACFNNTLEEWCPNKTLREQERQKLSKTIKAIIDNPNLADSILKEDPTINRFHKMFEMNLAKTKYQAANNYLKNINDREAFKNLDKKMSQIINDPKSIINNKKEVKPLSNDEVLLLRYLSLVENYFSFNLIESLITYLKLDKKHLLQHGSLDRFLISNNDDKTLLKISKETALKFKEPIDEFERNQILSFYGSYHHQLAHNALELRDAIKNTTKSIYYWHKVKNFKRSKIIIKSYIHKYKLLGKYDDLSRIIKFQIENDTSSKDDEWLNFNYAHANYLLGNFEESLRAIRPILYQSKPLKYGDIHKIREYIKLELKIYLLYTELLSAIGQPDDAIRILLGKINIVVKQDYSISQLDWQVVSQSISNLSWYFIEKKEYDTALRILVKLKKSTIIIQNDRSIAILKARIGISLYYNSKYEDSVKELTESLYLFQSANDERGVAWVCGYLLCNYLIDENAFNSGLVKDYFIKCLGVNSINNLFDIRYYEIIKTFSKNVDLLNLDDGNLELLNDELRRLEILNQRVKKSIKKDEYVKIFYVIIRSIENEDVDMYDLINRFLNKKTVKIKTHYFKTYLRKVKNNASKILENLFVRYMNKEIFLNHQLNKLITEAVKFDETALDNYIIPKIQYINENTNDPIKKHYVRALKTGNRQKFALEILNSVSKKDEDYYNLKGNCLIEIDRKRSLQNYSKAIELSKSKFNRAKYLNNMAWVIYNTGWRNMYVKGIEYCEMSLVERRYSHYSWPYSLRCLLLLKIDLWKTTDVVPKMFNYLNENKINIKVLKGIINEVHNKAKANKLLSLIDKKKL